MIVHAKSISLCKALFASNTFSTTFAKLITIRHWVYSGIEQKTPPRGIEFLLDGEKVSMISN